MYAAQARGTVARMTDLGDPQDRAEALDTEMISDEYDDPEGALVYPPDRPAGVREYGTTAAEERTPEALDERVRRDAPDPLDAVVEPTDEELSTIEAEDLNELVAAEEAAERLRELDETALDDLEGSGERVGRLIEPHSEDDPAWSVDIEADAVALRVDEDQADLSAEEEAVHITEAPPFGRLGDGYIEVDNGSADRNETEDEV